jgi:hypothetical protein
MGCLFFIFAGPVKFLRWSFTHGWKGLIVLVVVVVFLLIGISATRSAVNEASITNPPAAPAIVLPGRNTAPYKIVTSSRIYYAAMAVKAKDATVTITDYWELIRGDWTINKGVLVLDKYYGEVTITKRRKGQ